MKPIYKIRGGGWGTSERDKIGSKRGPSDAKKRKKRTKYDTISKVRMSVFGQILAVSHRLTTNNNNMTYD